MKFLNLSSSSVVVWVMVAAAAVASMVAPQVEAAAAAAFTPRHNQPANHQSELHYSTIVEAPEEFILQNVESLQSLAEEASKLQQVTKKDEEAARRRRRQVQQLERQFKKKSAAKRTTVSPRIKQRLRQRRPTTTTAAAATAVALPTTTTTADSHKKSTGLTREQEVTFSQNIRTFRQVCSLRQLPQDNDPRRWAAAAGVTVTQLKRILEVGQASRAAIVAANIGLVTNLAQKQYSTVKRAVQTGGGAGSIGTILTLQDLIQEGNLGLMEAAERYEPERGFRFSTYATWWVRQRMQRAVVDQSRSIRLPAHVHQMLSKIHKAQTAIRSQTGKEATHQEVAAFLNVPAEKVQLYTDSSRNVVSLEQPIRQKKDDSREVSLGDTLASDAPTPEEDCLAIHLRQDILALLDTALEGVERDVICARFGLDDTMKPTTISGARTVQETAVTLGLTADKVRVVEARALNKLRQPQRNYKLKHYVTSSTAAARPRRARQPQAVNNNKSNSNNHKPQQQQQQQRRPAQQQDPSRIWFF